MKDSSERGRALIIAAKILDRLHPDDDLAVLARALKRAQEERDSLAFELKRLRAGTLGRVE